MFFCFGKPWKAQTPCTSTSLQGFGYWAPVLRAARGATGPDAGHGVCGDLVALAEGGLGGSLGGEVHVSWFFGWFLGWFVCFGVWHLDVLTLRVYLRLFFFFRVAWILGSLVGVFGEKRRCRGGFSALSVTTHKVPRLWRQQCEEPAAVCGHARERSGKRPNLDVSWAKSGVAQKPWGKGVIWCCPSVLVKEPRMCFLILRQRNSLHGIHQPFFQ